MKALLYLFITACLATSMASCASVGSGSETVPSTYGKHSDNRLATDSVHWADTITMGGCNAKAVVAGQYPVSGSAALVDSIRAWLGDRLSYGMITDGSPLFRPTAAEISSGRRLVARAGMAMIDQARKDFKEFNAEGIDMSYEYMYSFGPTYQTDSIVTYGLNGYVYLGGAHGGSLGSGQSFNANNGAMLTAGNMFAPGKTAQLISLIRNGLWEQYFKENAEPGQTLKDMLLINPDTLALPTTPPLFDPDGLIFIYQQYEIAPYADGMPACTLPYSAVKPLMRPEVARLL